MNGAQQSDCSYVYGSPQNYFRWGYSSSGKLETADLRRLVSSSYTDVLTQFTYRNTRRLHTVSFTMTVRQQTPLHFCSTDERSVASPCPERVCALLRHIRFQNPVRTPSSRLGVFLVLLIHPQMPHYRFLPHPFLVIIHKSPYQAALYTGSLFYLTTAITAALGCA